MATIIGGIGTSHVPTIGVAFDKGKQDDPAWAPLFEGYAPVARWLAEQRPDVLVFFYNDHATSFFFDLYPTFALGVSPSFELPDEGAGRRPLPAIKGHPGLAIHLAESLVNDEFDLATFQERPLDHGCNSPLSMLWPHEPDWPGAVVPIAINVLQYPLPTAMRCYKLGQAVRRAVESYAEDLRVVVVGTGGLSHQIHGERTGFNNTAWDLRFLDLIERDPLQLARMRHAEYVELGGAEGVEVIMWLAMRGALSSDMRKLHQHYYLPMTTAMTVTLYEEPAARTRRPGDPARRTGAARVNPQLEGIEKVGGTYPFDLATSVRTLRINRFFWRMADPAHRARFLADEAALCASEGLTEAEGDLVRRRDWLGLIRYGVNFFVLEKFARVVKLSNPDVYASMRGETLETFLATRNVPGAR